MAAITSVTRVTISRNVDPTGGSVCNLWFTSMLAQPTMSSQKLFFLHEKLFGLDSGDEPLTQKRLREIAEGSPCSVWIDLSQGKVYSLRENHPDLAGELDGIFPEGRRRGAFDWYCSRWQVSTRPFYSASIKGVMFWVRRTVLICSLHHPKMDTDEAALPLAGWKDLGNSGL